MPLQGREATMINTTLQPSTVKELWVRFQNKLMRISLSRTPVYGKPVLLLADDTKPSELCSYNPGIPNYRVLGCVVSTAHTL